MQYNLDNIATAAAYIIKEIGTTKVICFNAPMGAGKTTLIKEICTQLGVTDTISSPTFSIINTYGTNDGDTIYHLDLYRIQDEEELLQAGVEDVLYSGNLCLLEWPQIAEFILPKDALLISIFILEEQKRELNIVNYFP